jgi:hypothetical protein
MPWKSPELVILEIANKLWWDIDRYLLQAANGVRLKKGQQKACIVVVIINPPVLNRLNFKVVSRVEDFGC